MGARLRVARKRRKLTGEQLGQRIGVSKSAISQWEKDAALPALENLVALCEVLDVSADYLLRGTDSASIPQDVIEMSKRLTGLDERGLAALRALFAPPPGNSDDRSD
jgi:transcriptional regulator with XRE-family HTH domain